MNRHNHGDLKQMQSLPLEAKIIMTQQRIRQWYDHWDGDVYVSFSGGKDSTVLKHIVDHTPGVHDVPAVFVNTGLEYPEIQWFVKDIQAGKYSCFNPNVEIIRPEMRFDEVIKKYGYPVIGKEVAKNVAETRSKPDGYAAQSFDPTSPKVQKYGSRYDMSKWRFLIDAPFLISDRCCHVMKKMPGKRYQKETGRKKIVATMACESQLRNTQWLKKGCNAFEGASPRSAPMSFWTEQDVLLYIKKYIQAPLDTAWKDANSPCRTRRKKARKYLRRNSYKKYAYCSVYGDIRVKQPEDMDKGQLNMIDMLGCYEPEDTLETTGCDRTGCVFCMFGITQDGCPNRFQRLKETHPRQYEYCINGGEMVDGKWQPSKEGLGLGKVLDYIGVKYD